MKIGVLTVTLEIPDADSLKDKRHVVRSLLANVRHKFNVSAAEVSFLDALRRAELGFSVVANDGPFVNSVLDKVVDYIESSPEYEVAFTQIELIDV